MFLRICSTRNNFITAFTYLKDTEVIAPIPEDATYAASVFSILAKALER